MRDYQLLYLEVLAYPLRLVHVQAQNLEGAFPSSILMNFWEGFALRKPGQLEPRRVALACWEPSPAVVSHEGEGPEKCMQDVQHKVFAGRSGMYEDGLLHSALDEQHAVYMLHLHTMWYMLVVR